eukprot:1247433-Pyramimonas_sp.AAC.1
MPGCQGHWEPRLPAARELPFDAKVGHPSSAAPQEKEAAMASRDLDSEHEVGPVSDSRASGEVETAMGP